MSGPGDSGAFVKDSYTRAGILPRAQVNTIGRMLSHITFGRGIIGRVSASGIHIEAEAGTSLFSGTAYTPNGEKITGLNSDSSKPFVKYSASTNSFAEDEGPMPEPWGGGDVWFVKASTAGDIIVTRLG